MTPIPDTACASAEKVASAILLVQSHTPCREQFAMLVKAVQNIRLAEQQRQAWERRGILIAQVDMWEALHSPRLIEGESVWGA